MFLLSLFYFLLLPTSFILPFLVFYLTTSPISFSRFSLLSQADVELETLIVTSRLLQGCQIHWQTSRGRTLFYPG